MHTCKRILILLCLLLFLTAWYQHTESRCHYTPDYSEADLLPILQKEQLTEDDYRLLFYQTGLAPSAVDTLMQSVSDPIAILAEFQKHFFAEAEIRCTANTFLSREEHLTSSIIPLAPCQNADILYTNASHTLFYRNGHAGLVTDSQKGQTLEAALLGSPSSIQSLSKWQSFPNFVLFTMRQDSPALRTQIAASAIRQLNNIPYRLSAGILTAPPDVTSPLQSTHCAHLVWSAYYVYGIDLDSDGGPIVTPHDLTGSTFLKPLQIYGVDPSLYEDALFAE